MNSDQLITKQAELLDTKLRLMLGYLNRLRRRMEQQGFASDDPLYWLTGEAMHNLSGHLSCGHGMGRPSRPK